MSEYTTAELKAECEAAMAGRYDRVAAIKKLRELNGWGLREALDWFNREFPRLSDPPVYRNDYQRGLAEGRRQGLEEAAKTCEATIEYAGEDLNTCTQLQHYHFAFVRNKEREKLTAAIRELIKEPTT